MKIRFKVSLTMEFIALVVAIVVFVMTVFSYFFISTYKSFFVQSLQLHTKRQAYRLADSVVNSVSLKRNDIIEHYVGNTIRESDIVCVEVYDKKLKRLAGCKIMSKRLEEDLSNHKINKNADILFEKPNAIEYFYKYKGKTSAFEFIAPVIFYGSENTDGEVIGCVRVISSFKSINEKLAKIIKNTLLLAVYVILISMLLAFFVIRLLIEPINKVVNITRQISQGDFSNKVPLFKERELRILAISVNMMSSHLKKILDVLHREKESLLNAQKSLEVKNRAIRELALKERQMHIKLIKEERFNTIGTLAGSLAHEIKNPLTSFKNIIYFISKMETFEKEESKKMFNMLTDNVTRINNILTELLDYSEAGNLNKTQNYIDELINKIIRTIYIPNNINLKMDLKHIAVLSDKESFSKVIRHLVMNAVDAMPFGGNIFISAYKVENKLELKIRDTGSGIDSDVIKSIYKPLYTTKVKGIGLGLSIVKEIVEGHKGTILLNTKIGKGTEFILHIPGAV